MNRARRGIVSFIALPIGASLPLGALGCGDKTMLATEVADHDLDGGADRANGDDISFVDSGGISPIDPVACATLPAGHCESIMTEYSSNKVGDFGKSPELSTCAQFNSFDGCGKLEFSFDDEGCLRSATSFPTADNLGSLRTCFALGLGPKRWPCLMGGRIAYDESCFVP